MNILIIGSGGREHALAWKIKQSPLVEKIFCAPGNGGIAGIAETVPLSADDFAGLADFAKKENIGLTVVGPEVPLSNGIVDHFEASGLAIFGPNKLAAQLEASKKFAKDLMRKYNIPTAAYRAFKDHAQALSCIDDSPEGKPLVIKANGLAAGKGVVICEKTAAKAFINEIMNNKVFGAAGDEVIVEEFLHGQEVSVQIFLDGEHYRLLASAQDHKRAYDGDKGPNTGGMGTYAPAPLFEDTLRVKTKVKVIEPLIKAFKNEGISYKGVLYIGLMVVKNEPYVLEFNCRFGDPETQVVLPLLKTDLVEIMQKVNQGALDKIKIEWYNTSAVCVILASGGYPGDYSKGKPVNGLEKAGARENTIVFHAGTAVDKATGKLVTSGGRVFGVTGLGKTIREAIDTAYAAVPDINFEGMQYRKDIAKRAL